MTELTISYETLFDIFRNEKKNTELQSLPKDFYKLVSAYVSSAEGDKKNILKILEDIYERRERKIINCALVATRTKTRPESLLPEEEELFDQISEVVSKFRKINLSRLLNPETEKPDTDVSETQEEKTMEQASETPEENENENILVRFIQPVPKFVGKKLEVYGPFENEDMANLPAEIAKLLIQKERAVRVRIK